MSTEEPQKNNKNNADGDFERPHAILNCFENYSQFCIMLYIGTEYILQGYKEIIDLRIQAFRKTNIYSQTLDCQFCQTSFSKQQETPCPIMEQSHLKWVRVVCQTSEQNVRANYITDNFFWIAHILNTSTLIGSEALE